MIVTHLGTELGLRSTRRNNFMNRYIWRATTTADEDVRQLAESLGAPLAGARLLASRGITDADAAHAFFEPPGQLVHSPQLFTVMNAAVAITKEAASRKVDVLVHGDYDVDGISGTALLFQYLEGIFPNVYRFIPDRAKDGYGVSDRAIEWAKEKKVGLFIAVDCGTSDGDKLQRLEEASIPVIVCDHHTLPPDGKTAGVLINPMRPDETYPNKFLCGTAVAYKFISALWAAEVRGKTNPDELLDLVALATIADVVPLVGENRVLAKRGLQLMNKTPRAGIDAMRGFARIGADPITSTTVAFSIAPRLNAPGRVSRAKPSLELLCATDKARAFQLATHLEAENETRKKLTSDVSAAVAHKLKAATTNPEALSSFVFADEGWAPGVLGIAAARLVDRYRRPAILLSVEGDKAVGSGRSVAGVDLKSHLDALAGHFEKYGGHAQAVGMTMSPDNVESFGAALQERVAQEIEPGWQPELHIDAWLDLEECSMDLLDFLARCEPFGNENPEPVWQVSDVQVSPDTTIVGENHMKLFFTDMRGVPGDAIAFNWERDETAEDLAGRVIDLAVTIKRSSFNGRVYPELRVVDVRFH